MSSTSLLGLAHVNTSGHPIRMVLCLQQPFHRVYKVHLLGPKPATCALARIEVQLAARNLLFYANSGRCSCNCWHFDCHNMHPAPSTPAHGNKQLVDLYYKIIFTPSSRHKKQKTSQGSFAAAVRRCRNKHRERGGARERKREGSSAVKLALNYLARSWFPPLLLPLRLAQVKAGHIVCKSARAAAQAGWGKRASKGQKGLWQCKFIT